MSFDSLKKITNIPLTEIQNVDKKENLARRLTLFLTIYVLLNYFVLNEIYKFLELEKTITFTLLLVFLSFSYVLGTVALRYSNNFLALFANVIGSTWLGFIVISAFIFLLAEILFFSGLIQIQEKQLIAFIIIFLMTLIAVVNAMFTIKKRITIKSNKITKPVKIIQISDLHIGAAHKKNFLHRIIEKINKEKPDITVITGDLIDGKHKYKDGYFDELKKINSSVYMVIGNHERMTGMNMVNDLLKNSNVIMLRNNKIELNEITLFGIDDTDKKKEIITNLKKLKPNEKKYNILLYHKPVKFKQARKQGINLMLTGHTHAGQILPLTLLQKLFFRKVQGIKRRKNFVLYVSPGTGWWGPPMRLGSRNEITIFNIEPDKK